MTEMVPDITQWISTLGLGTYWLGKTIFRFFGNVKLATPTVLSQAMLSLLSFILLELRLIDLQNRLHRGARDQEPNITTLCGFLKRTSIKWNVSSLTFKWRFNLINPKSPKYDDMAFESQIGHIPFNVAALKNLTFRSSKKRLLFFNIGVKALVRALCHSSPLHPWIWSMSWDIPALSAQSVSREVLVEIQVQLGTHWNLLVFLYII